MCVVVIVVGIIKLHELPGEIAARIKHPQVEEIKICSLLGLILVPFWMFALLWAYMKPVLTPIPLETNAVEPGETDEQTADGAQF